MNMVKIDNFGPVSHATLDLDKGIQVFIGSQASGKSTISKMVYFCQKIRDYTLDFLMDKRWFAENHPNEYFSNYMKFLTQRFMDCFGKTTHMRKFRIEYFHGNRKITIKLNRDGFVRYEYDLILKKEITNLLHDAADLHLVELSGGKLVSIMDNITALGMMRQQIQKKLNDLFESHAEIIYIPAGRSLLATLSEQLSDVSFSVIDLTMQEFINLIRETKDKFGSKIPEMVKDYTKTVKGQIDNNAVKVAYELIKEILKADYASDSEGEKIYFDERHWVKLMYSSSGQQEVL